MLEDGVCDNERRANGSNSEAVETAGKSRKSTTEEILAFFSEVSVCP